MRLRISPERNSVEEIKVEFPQLWLLQNRSREGRKISVNSNGCDIGPKYE